MGKLGKFGKIIDFFMKPSIALLSLLIFLVAFFLSEGLTTGFGNFLSFGPTQNINGEPVKFIGISLNTWKNVVIAYVIIFIATLLNSYYTWAVDNKIDSYVWNPTVKKVPYNKFWTYLILIINPALKTILYIIRFFATATFQLQFIIPQFVASYIFDLPFTLLWLNKKKFID